MNEEVKYRIVELLARTRVIKTECNRICGDNPNIEDLEQDVTIILLEYDADKIVSMNKSGKLINFIRTVIKRQYKSENSPFYATYKKHCRYEVEGEWDRLLTNINKEESNEVF